MCSIVSLYLFILCKLNDLEMLANIGYTSFISYFSSDRESIGLLFLWIIFHSFQDSTKTFLFFINESLLVGSLEDISLTKFNYIDKVATLTRELYLLAPIRFPAMQSFLSKIEDICCTVECGVVSPHRVVTSNASTVPTPASYLDWLTLNSINIRWSVITAITLSYPSLNNANNGSQATQ